MKKFLTAVSVVITIAFALISQAHAQVGYMDIPTPGWLCDQSRVGCGAPRGNYGHRYRQPAPRYYAPRPVYRPVPQYFGHGYRQQPRKVCNTYPKGDGSFHTHCHIYR